MSTYIARIRAGAVALLLTIGTTQAVDYGWNQLTYDDFEAGWGNFSDGGNDCLLYTGGTSAHQGNAAMDLQDNTTTSVSALTNGLDLVTPGYTRLKVAFWYYTVEFGSGHDFWIQYSDDGGGSYATIGTFALGSDFAENLTFYSGEVITESTNVVFTTNSTVQFRCDAGSDQDDVYIDEIRISAWWPGLTGGAYWSDDDSVYDASLVAAKAKCTLLNTNADVWIFWDTVNHSASLTWPNENFYGSDKGPGVIGEAGDLWITNLTADTKYYYIFYASNNTDTSWSRTDHSFATALSPAVTPTAVSITDKSPGHLTICWNESFNTESGFVVRRADDAGFSLNVVDFLADGNGTTSYKDSVVEPATTYYYKVAATNGAGLGSFSSSVSDTTDPWIDGILYVDPEKNGSGFTWAGAAPSLDKVCSLMSSIGFSNQVWIAQGTGIVSETAVVTVDDVTIYGGFTNGMSSPAQRDPSAFPSVVSGDLLRKVLTVEGDHVTLDGIVVQDGYASSAANGVGVLVYNAGAGITTFTMRDCVVRSCRPKNGSTVNYNGVGVGIFGDPSSGVATVTGCTFVGNKPIGPGSISSNGGIQRGIGLWVQDFSHLNISDCVFDRNEFYGGNANGWGGGIGLQDVGTATITDSVIIDNGVGNKGGGGGVYLMGTTAATLAGCVLRNNKGDGGAMNITGGGASAFLQNCVVSGNGLEDRGAPAPGILIDFGATMWAMNCTFSDNKNEGTDSRLAICGGAISASGGGAVGVTNCIFQGNIIVANTWPDTIYWDGAGSFDVAYSWFDGTSSTYISNAVTLGSGIIGGEGEDPLFASEYDDLHLKSTTGRWYPLTSIWTNDLVDSPCIDVGVPGMSIGNEPSPNGGRINMGAYGGTAEASWSPPPVGWLLIVR